MRRPSELRETYNGKHLLQQSNPGVGYYDPQPVEKSQPAAASVFQSATNRGERQSTRQIIE